MRPLLLAFALRMLQVNCDCGNLPGYGTYFGQNCAMHACDIGTYTTSLQATECFACPTGTACAYGCGPSCPACGQGTYADTAGSISCTQCAGACDGVYGQYSSCGADTAGSCQWCANAGTYNYYTTDGGYSATCDLGAAPAGTYRLSLIHI